jgi:O-antigen/teichoic acid export membrane protein
MMRDALTRGRWLRWVRLGAFAITDQALISGSNFLVSVLLARWLVPADFGMYAICFSLYLLILSFYQAVILEPLCVFGTGEYRDTMPSYVAGLVRLHLALSVALGALLGLAALGAHLLAPAQNLGAGLAGLALACPFLLLFWLARTAAYVALGADAAARAAFLYVAVLFGSMAVLRAIVPISTALAFLLLGLAAAVVAARLLHRLRPEWRAAHVPLREIWREHWGFGRWELSKVVFDWVGENVSYAVVGSVLGLAQVAMLKALTTLFLPMSHTLTALRRIVLPHLAKLSNHSGHTAVRGPVQAVLALYAGNAIAYGVVAVAFAAPLAHLMYGGKYQGLVSLVPWYAVATVFSVAIVALDMGLRAVRSPKAMFTSSVAGGVTSLCVSWPLAAALGVRGVIVAGIVTSSVVLLSMATVLRRRLEQPEPAAAAVAAD